MIYLVTALAQEAIPLIHFFKLKKDISYTKFDVFKNESITLIITGTSKMRSAVGTTYLLTKEPPKGEAKIINFGICGSGREEYKTGTMFLINKIEDHITGRNYYPEILFKHSLPEEGLITYEKPVDRRLMKEKDIPLALVDMEASGFYEGASLFFHSHKIILLKIISDHLKPQKFTGAFVQSLIEKNLTSLQSFIKQTDKVKSMDTEVLDSNDYLIFENLSNELKLSTTQRFQVLDLLKGYKVRKGADVDFLQEYIKKGKSSKHQSKQYNKKLLEEIMFKLGADMDDMND